MKTPINTIDQHDMEISDQKLDFKVSLNQQKEGNGKTVNFTINATTGMVECPPDYHFWGWAKGLAWGELKQFLIGNGFQVTKNG